MRYVALGDSYTIGTSVGEADRWPNLLVERLAAAGVRLELVGNLAVDGSTSGDVVERQQPRVAALNAELLTLQLGGNDVVRGVDEAAYASNVGAILDAAGALPSRPVVVTIETPDYTRTPAGADFGEPAQRRAGLVRVNAALCGAAEARGPRFVDGIFEISQAVVADPSLVAPDGLHPSGAQYRRWVDRIAPVVIELLT